jgi:cyclophilin family peptidyl-prolyl cis-trans isomerase
VKRLAAGLAGLLGLLVACSPGAAPASTPTPRPPAPTQASGAQVSANLTGIPASKPAASPSAQGGSVSAAPRQFSAPPQMQIDPSKTYTATIDTTMGSMKADLFASDAPITVNNFVFLAQQHYYDGSPFHRIIKGFMVQTGDPVNRNGTGGPGYRFQDEPVKRSYERGTLAMANAGPNTNGSQFFIVQGTNVNLPPNYTIFGKLTSGLDTLDKIATTPTGPGRGGPDTPRTPITINTITITES